MVGMRLLKADPHHRGDIAPVGCSAVSALDVDGYLREIAPVPRAALQTLRDTLLTLLPDGEECMSYAMPCVKVKGKAIAGYAAFARHNSYFPHSGRVLPELAEADPQLLRGLTWSTGTLRFGPSETLPEALVARLVAIRRRHLGV
jgi:uncharacterized protein YdhG (YjbR/CyaY superfamily)